MESKNPTSLNILDIIKQSLSEFAKNSKDPNAEQYAKIMMSIFDFASQPKAEIPKSETPSPTSNSEKKLDEFGQRLLDIVNLCIRDKQQGVEVVSTLNGILTKHSEKSFNGFSSTKVAEETLGFLFPQLEVQARSKLSVLMVAPIL